MSGSSASSGGKKKTKSERRLSKRKSKNSKEDVAAKEKGKKRKRGQAVESSAEEEAAVALPCPWGETLVDLRTKKLTEEEKRWLANEFISKRQSSKELHEKYSIPKTTLWKYVQQVKLKRVLHCKGGRPRAIDETSMSVLLEKLKGKPNMPDEELRPLIRTEYQKSCIRQYPDKLLPKEGERKKSKRKKFKALNYVSVIRYCDELRKKIGAKPGSRSKSSASSSAASSAPASIPVGGESCSKKGKN